MQKVRSSVFTWDVQSQQMHRGRKEMSDYLRLWGGWGGDSAVWYGALCGEDGNEDLEGGNGYTTCNYTEIM